MQIIISAVISTAISLVILNKGADIHQWIVIAVENTAAWLRKKCKKKRGDD